MCSHCKDVISIHPMANIQNTPFVSGTNNIPGKQFMYLNSPSTYFFRYGVSYIIQIRVPSVPIRGQYQSKIIHS